MQTSQLMKYIWIDGSNGVRSKTKVRDLPVAPMYSLNAKRPAIFGAGEVTEALLSGRPVIP